MKAHIPPSDIVGWRTWRAWWASCLALTFLALEAAAPARSQEPPRPAESIAEAARNVREQKPKYANPSKIITNDDIGVQASASSISEPPPVSSSAKLPEAPKPRQGECENPDAERLKAELAAAQDERDQVHRELSYQPVVISGGGVDLKNFKSNSSGLNVEVPALSQTEPLTSSRVTEVMLDEKISSLKKSLTIACDSSKDAGIQRKVDAAEQELHLLQGQLALDQDTYYSRPNYAEDTAGKAKLDAEQQQFQELQSELQRLKEELAASNSN